MIITERSWRLNFRSDSKEDFNKLKTLKRIGETKKFTELLVAVMAPIGAYIENELKIAIEKNLIPEGKFQTSDILDDLMIKVYDEIEDLDINTHLPSWLYQQAYQMLEDMEIEEEFNSFFFENIDDIGELEWSAMDEEFTRDGDGDLVMIEELDDLSYPHYEYSLSDVFTTDTELAQIEHLDEILLKERAGRAIAKILKHLPIAARSIYNLHYQHGLEVRLISQIKKQPEKQIAEVLEKIQKTVRQIIEIQFIGTQAKT